jgi:hypothetical protein
MNPRRVGLFAWQVWSHKILRWLVLPIVMLAAAGCLVAYPLGVAYQIGAWGFTASLLIAGLGALVPGNAGRLGQLAHGVFYFYLVNLAALIGIAMAVVGRVEMLWTPERG